MEKFEKDILTIENVITDYKTIFLKRIRLTVLCLIFLPPILCLLIYLIVKLHIVYKLLLGFLLFILLWFLCCALLALFRECKYFRDITNKKFRIEVDILNQKKETTVGRRLSAETFRILSFNKYKDFLLPKYLPLPSAKNFDLNEKELFDSSKIEDKFYLVVDTKENILIVYSTKHFELQ